MKQEPLMSAEKTHEENTARKEDEPLIPPAVPFWMRMTVQPDGSETPQDPGLETAEGHDGAPDDTPENDETYAILLQAIQGTEFARLLGGMPPPNDGPLPQTFGATEPEAITAAPDANPPAVSPASEATASAPAPLTTAPMAASDEIAEHGEASAAPIEAVEDAEKTTVDVAAPAGGEAAQGPVLADLAATTAESAESEPPVAVVATAAAPEAEPVVAETAALESGGIATVAPGPDEAPPEPAGATQNATKMEVAAPAEEIAPEEAATAEATDSATAKPEAEPAAVEAEPVVVEMPATAPTEAEPVEAPAMRTSENGEEIEISAARLQQFEEAQLTEDVEDAAATDAAALQEPLTANAAEIAPPSCAVDVPAALPALANSEPRKPDARGVAQPSRDGLRRRKGHRGGKGRFAAPRGRNVSTRTHGRVRSVGEAAESKPQGPEPEAVTAAASQSVAEGLASKQESVPPIAPVEPEPPRPSSALRIFEVPVLPQTPPPAMEAAAVEHEEVESPESAEPARIDEASSATETAVEAAKDVSPGLPAPAVEAAAATECEPVDLPTAAESNAARKVSSPAEPAPESAATVSSPEPPARDKNGTAKGASSGRLGNGLGRVTLRQTGEYLDRAEMHLETWFLKWFDPPDPRRRNARVAAPPLAAYHWTMDVPQGLKIADISPAGMYLVTEERWTEGVIVSLTLQRTDMEKGSPDSWIAVDFVVTRWGQDGIGGEFIPRRPGLTDAVAGRASNCADKKTLERFVSQLATTAQQRLLPADENRRAGHEEQPRKFN
jgi:hypothetical protein